MLLFKLIFEEHFVVSGIFLELRPFCRSNAEPQLTLQTAYLRLAIQGQVKKWTVGPLLDMREMNYKQIHEAIEEVMLYGHEPETTPLPSTPSSRLRSIPAQPALPPRQNDQLEEAQIMNRPAADGDGEVVEAPYEATEEFEVVPRAEIQPIKPNYNLKLVLRRLSKLYEEENYARCKQLLGFHERLRHSPISDFTNLLLGEIIRLAEEAVKSYAVCRKYVSPPNRP
jgi:hypothetical protein